MQKKLYQHNRIHLAQTLWYDPGGHWVGNPFFSQEILALPIPPLVAPSTSIRICMVSINIIEIFIFRNFTFTFIPSFMDSNYYKINQLLSPTVLFEALQATWIFIFRNFTLGYFIPPFMDSNYYKINQLLNLTVRPFQIYSQHYKPPFLRLEQILTKPNFHNFQSVSVQFQV